MLDKSRLANCGRYASWADIVPLKELFAQLIAVMFRFVLQVMPFVNPQQAAGLVPKGTTMLPERS